ncbi:MAG: oligosaccharide flippase family protein, partial [Chloroflexota bacterium]
RQVPYSWNWGFMRRLFAYAVPLGLASVFGTFAMQIGKWVVAGRFSAAEYAVFDIAARELPFIGIITGSIMAVLIPEFVRQYEKKDLKEILRLWHAATSKTALFLIPLTGLLAVFAKDVVLVLYSDKYLPAVGIFLVYLLFLPLRITQYGALLMAAGESSLILWSHAAAVPLCLVLCLVLTSSLGAIGAAIGTVLTIYAVAAALLVRCTRILKVGLPEILPWNKLTRIALATAAASVSALWATSTMTPGLGRLALGAVIFGILAGMILLSMGATRQEIRTAITAIRVVS